MIITTLTNDVVSFEQLGPGELTIIMSTLHVTLETLNYNSLTYINGAKWKAKCPPPKKRQMREDGFVCNKNGRVCEYGVCTSVNGN